MRASLMLGALSALSREKARGHATLCLRQGLTDQGQFAWDIFAFAEAESLGHGVPEMEIRNESVPSCLRFDRRCMAASATILGAQQTSPSDPYQGTSNPPPDDTIITSKPQAPEAAPAVAPQPQPSPAHPAYSQPAPVQSVYQAQEQQPQAGTTSSLRASVPPSPLLRMVPMTASLRLLPISAAARAEPPRPHLRS